MSWLYCHNINKAQCNNYPLHLIQSPLFLYVLPHRVKQWALEGLIHFLKTMECICDFVLIIFFKEQKKKAEEKEE